MQVRRWIIVLMLAAGLAIGANAQQKGGEDKTGPYEVIPSWPQLLRSVALVSFTSMVRGSAIGQTGQQA